MPAGDLARAPQPPTFPEGWALGRPDVVLTLPRSIDVPADGPDLYRNVVLPLDLAEDKWITAVDFEPSARKVVHHALFFLSPAADSGGIRADEVLPGLGGGLLGGSGPGAPRRRRPGWGRRSRRGRNRRLGPGHDAAILSRRDRAAASRSHQRRRPTASHPSGKVEHEQGRLAIYFAKQRPAKSLLSVQVPPQFGFAMGIDIPAGQARYTIDDSFVLPVDVEAFGARGHAHYLAKEMKMTATLPDGSVKGLLWIGDWDFGWQDSYLYTSPFTLPKGTRIDVTIAYDNSAANVRNPSAPPRRVRWGSDPSTKWAA